MSAPIQLASTTGAHVRRASSASAATGPPRVVPNAEIVEAIDSSDEWIQQRSGHHERRCGRRRGDRRR